MELQPGETVLREGPANLQRGIETVGGKLWLTNARLVFRAHAFNVQTGETQIALDDVTGVKPCWTKFLNVLPLAPNSLAATTEEAEFKFVLFGRKKWAVAITEARGANGNV